MSVISFWNNSGKETGNTLSLVALATNISIEHNYKVLIISTGYREETLNNCFWEENKKTRNLGLFGPNNNDALEENVEGLARILRSNKSMPELITNYTKTIFKDRLEILKSYKGNENEYQEIAKMYIDILDLGRQYYDLIFVDISSDLKEHIKEEILENSNLVISTLNQGLSQINKYMKQKEEVQLLKSKKNLVLIGRYDRKSKYNIKNISRYMGEKNKVSTIPYNTLFFEASQEAKVVDLFLKMKRYSGSDDKNGFFMQEIKRMSENMLYRLQDLQMKM